MAMQSPSLMSRTKVLGINVATFYLIYCWASGQAQLTGGLECVWLMSALALWFITLTTPWFLPPRDSLASAVGALLILVTIELSSVSTFREELNIIRWGGVYYSLGVCLCSLAALYLHDAAPKAARTHLAYRLTGIFGKGEILYTTPAVVSILGSYQHDLSSMGWLLLAWMLFMIARPIERVGAAIHQYRTELAIKQTNDSVGVIDRIDDPDIVRLRLSQPSKWKSGTLHVAMMPGGRVHYVLALFNQVQGTEVIGTGLCLAVAQEDVEYRDVGHVYLSHEQDRAAEFIENLSGTPGAQLVGFTVENSTIGTLLFEVALSPTIEEGEIVYAKVSGRDVFYQIMDAETSEENFDQNPRGTHIVRAAQIGCYDDIEGFTKYSWLPPMNTPLFSAKSRKFAAPKLKENEYIVGKVPSTNVGVAVNLDEIVEYHAAILGVTGTGKTELALDLIRESIGNGIKVFCVDFTGDYAQRLKDLNPTFPALEAKDAVSLETKLFAVETGTYGAPGEKKVLKEELDRLKGFVTKQVTDFLEGTESNLAIFELPTITNTKATLRLTELYISQIMEWAKRNRKAQRIMIALEEAHTIVPETFSSGFDSDTQWVVGRIGQIALQGRKYGVGLLVITQRTALVSKTILSQCNTFFTHSLIDQTSLAFLENVYSSQHTRLIPNLSRFHFLAFGKALRAERPILLHREFDPAKKAASDALKRPLPAKQKDKTTAEGQQAITPL